MSGAGIKQENQEGGLNTKQVECYTLSIPFPISQCRKMLFQENKRAMTVDFIQDVNYAKTSPEGVPNQVDCKLQVSPTNGDKQPVRTPTRTFQ